jgi:parallel beta-helix repeat protein
MSAFQKILFVGLILSFCSFSLADSLVGHWKLDETSGDVAYDSAGTNNGAVSGAFWATGKIDGGLDFDGVDDKVIIPDSDVLTPANTMTLSYWIYTTGTQDAGVYKWASCSTRSYVLKINTSNNKVHFAVYAAPNIYDSIESVGTVSLNAWHLITATFNSGTAKIYIDGVLDNTKTMSISTIANDAQPLIFGGCWNDCSGTSWYARLNGMIDDVRLYDYALDANEVAALYAQAPQPHVATTYHVATTGLDTNAGTSKATAFATIQKGIDTAVNGDTVVVWPGTYDQQANFNGKAITVKSADAEPAIISNSSDYAFVFENAEEANSVLQNFIIAKGCFAIYASGSSPTIKNLTIVDNYFGIDAYDDAMPAVSNCIFFNNRFGDIEGVEPQYSWRIDQTTAPVSYWRFEETTGTKAYDEVGNNDGTITGATREPNGIVGGAMSFDGLGDYITVPDNASLDITGDITLMAWVKPTSFSWGAGKGRGGGYIASKWTTSSIAYSLTMMGSSPVFSLSNNGSFFSTSVFFSDLIMTANEWNYIVVKKEGSTMMAWLNGQKSQLSGMFAGAIYDSTAPFTIGSDSTGRYSFNGKIDEVAIYNRALSSAEIKRIYKASSAGYDYIDPMMADSDGGDYHLLSEYGRYDSNSAQWVLDDATSPCVDAGDPTDNPMGEPMPNGGRINIGAYGGMGHASKGGQWPLAFDYNTDGIVNFADFAKFAEHWLDKLPWVE